MTDKLTITWDGDYVITYGGEFVTTCSDESELAIALRSLKRIIKYLTNKENNDE